jgi:hypothetical protein
VAGLACLLTSLALRKKKEDFYDRAREAESKAYDFMKDTETLWLELYRSIAPSVTEKSNTGPFNSRSQS